jgi:hypothetical protein
MTTPRDECDTPMPSEVKPCPWTVGMRVRVNLDAIPEEHRQCEVGEIIKVQIHHARSPMHRRISYTVLFDEPYIKPERVLCENIRKITVGEQSISAAAREGRVNEMG